MADSIWIGDKTNGIELRPFDQKAKSGLPVLDEIVAYRNGEVILHIESMDDTLYWMRIQVGDHAANANIYAKNGRSHVEMTAENDPP